ncbi:MAG TPA: cbb3-type cytochrome oxidase assembly protein CcoS [Burkholderiaceae bacterium]|nr:cbb3-type cytochrome oxidase assembly protein CcoS [Burkholderiaceae bacterium]
MESLYLLIPLSVLLVLGIGGVLAWAVLTGQFDNLDREGRRILDEQPETADASAAAAVSGEEGHAAGRVLLESRPAADGNAPNSAHLT